MWLQIYYYEHLRLPEGGTTMTLLIWVLYAGLVIGSVLAAFDRSYCAGFVAALRDTGADAAERAISLDELKIRGKWYLRCALKPGKALRKMVAAAGDGSGSVRETGFYLPEETRAMAELRYENGKAPIRTLILGLVLLTAAAVAAQYVLPELLTMLDNFLGSI